MTVLHAFSALPGTNADGQYPEGLLLSGNTFYGLTVYGGTGDGHFGWGTVYRVDTDGNNFTVLYDLTKSIQAFGWDWPPVLIGNTLYSATRDGSNVFRLNTNGTGFTNLYVSGSFWPYSSVILSGESLFGTTLDYSTTNYYGGLYRMNLDGTGFTNLHSFTGNHAADPEISFILSNSVIYGTTTGGPYGFGTIFTMNTDGTGFTNIFNFHTNDGMFPDGGLILSSNMMYGTAALGGPNTNFGTVFKINLGGTGFTKLHDFSPIYGDQYTPNADGATPEGGLTLVGNRLYGTTLRGGAGGMGTIFSIRTDGSQFTTLYSFSAAPAPAYTNWDGGWPSSRLIVIGNKMYGTAYTDGPGCSGTVFCLTLPPPQMDIIQSGNLVILSWPDSAANFSLQTGPDLVQWNPVTNGIADDGTNYYFTNAVSTGAAFFRLATP